MIKNNIFKKCSIIVIIILFIGLGILPNISGNIIKNIENKYIVIDDWKYNLYIPLEKPTLVDDYQVKIYLNFPEFDYSKANADGSDLRFYDLNGNKLSYWIEEWNVFSTSIVWIKVLKKGTEKILIKYGNEFAKSESNGDETFIFFDDFTNSNWENKWESVFNPYVSVSNSEITITDSNGDRGYLVSKDTIPIGTIIRFRFKERRDGPKPPDGQVLGLFDVKPPGVVNNCMYTGDSAWWGDWGFVSKCCNGTLQEVTDFSGTPDYYNYRVNEFHWDVSVADFYYREKSMIGSELKASHEVVPEGDLYLQFEVTGKNTIICDWVTVTKLTTPGNNEIFFSDDFDDDYLNESKWTEIIDEGFYNETNQQLELTVYEESDKAREYFESYEFDVTLSATKSVCIKWDMTTSIGSTSSVGEVGLKVSDGINWIKASYVRMRDYTLYEDSNDGHYTNLNDDKKDGSWDNEIRIFQDKYCVRMDQDATTWITDELFSPNPKLKIIIFIDDGGGGSPSLFTKVAFDNIIVETPNLNPYQPIIIGPYIVKKWTLYDFKFYTTDPDGDDITYYIEWGDGSPCEWVGPVNSGETITRSHIWTDKITNLRVKAIDSNAYESLWKEFKLTNSKSKNIISKFIVKIISINSNNLNFYHELSQAL